MFLEAQLLLQLEFNLFWHVNLFHDFFGQEIGILWRWCRGQAGRRWYSGRRCSRTHLFQLFLLVQPYASAHFFVFRRQTAGFVEVVASFVASIHDEDGTGVIGCGDASWVFAIVSRR
jgi:hypothetical protein